jgi:hypothetical protein
MKELDGLAIICGLVLLFLVGLLWYVKPSPALWLLGSAAWACVTYPAFMWYITRRG